MNTAYDHPGSTARRDTPAIVEVLAFLCVVCAGGLATGIALGGIVLLLA